MAGFNLDNYVPVEDRIEAFYAQHPEGSIQTEIAHLDPLLVVVRDDHVAYGRRYIYSGELLPDDWRETALPKVVESLVKG